MLLFHVSVEGGIRKVGLLAEFALVVPTIHVVLAASLTFAAAHIETVATTASVLVVLLVSLLAIFLVIRHLMLTQIVEALLLHDSRVLLPDPLVKLHLVRNLHGGLTRRAHHLLLLHVKLIRLITVVLLLVLVLILLHRVGSV